jgi:predicted transcriptional regulator
MEVMRVIWKKAAPVTSAEVMKELPQDRKWAASTVLTFLSRLAGKGIIASEKKGGSNIFTACVTEKEYLLSETTNFLRQAHGGSTKRFFAALLDSEELSRKDIKELKKWFAKL